MEICVGGRQISVVPPLLNTISPEGGRGGGGGGGSPEKKKSIHTITAKRFSYPHTEFGVRRLRRQAVKLPQIRKCHFLVTLAFLDISSKTMCL